MIEEERNVLLVTAAVIADGDRILVARRAPGQHLAGYWEFPGGKIEAGESPEECLRRELSEELDVEIDVGEFLCRNQHRYDDRTIMLLAYEARLPLRGAPQAELRLSSHDAIRWLTASELLDIRLAPADVPIAEHLLAQTDMKRPIAEAGSSGPEGR